MTSLSDYPKELANVEKLSRLAHGITTVTVSDAFKADLATVANAAREMVNVSAGVTQLAKDDPMKALGLVGLAMLGAFQSGYKRALEDLGMREQLDG